jgi:hypothetical protein
MTQYSGKVIRKTPVTPTQQAASGVWKLNEQAAAIRNNNWPVPGVPNPISRSVRLRSSATAYFNRTPAIAGNRRTWTWSGWIKRGAFTQSQLFCSRTAASPYSQFQFLTADTLQFVDSASAQLVTTQVFRDPSAWYHIMLSVDTTQATAANRLRLYVNGSQVTAFSTATYPTQNADLNMNTATAHTIGRLDFGATEYLDGYLTEINFIDGQALTPSSFGTTDPLTGVWEPIPYTGTYGTNGFYLNFKDNTSTTTLGYDYSGNSNNWNANNISLTSGSTYDSMLDVPTQWIGYSTTTDTSAVTRGNYGTLNATSIGADCTLSGGNLNFAYGSSSTRNCTMATIGMSSGKWYWEVLVTAQSASGTAAIGISSLPSASDMPNYPGFNASGWGYLSDGTRYNNLSGVSYGATYAANDVIGVAFDADVGSLVFYKNNTSQGTAYSSLTSGPYFPAIGDGSATNTWSGSINFGQRPFSYTPPSGFKTLVTTNLPDSTIVQGNQWMDATTYTGNGSTLSVTNSASMQPDLVWVKARSLAYSNYVYDSVRGTGTTKSLITDATAVEGAGSANANLTSFNSNGFSLGTTSGLNGMNANAGTFVGWQWRASGTTVTNTAGSITSTVSASTTSGFSVVTYTGNNVAGATIGHGLGVAPSIIIVKKRSATGDWPFYHKSLGATGELVLNSTTAFITIAGVWNNTAPTSSVFSVGGGGASGSADVNTSGATFVAYLFADVAGFSKFGSFTGNGSADGPFVYTGFRPKFVLLKPSTAVQDWMIVDTSRSTYNVTNSVLAPNSSLAESSFASGYDLDILSNGFKMRNSVYNANGATIIYAAFAENPFKNALAR